MQSAVFTKLDGSALLLNPSHVLKASRNVGNTTVSLIGFGTNTILETPEDMNTAFGGDSHIVLTSSGTALAVNRDEIEWANRNDTTGVTSVRLFNNGAPSGVNVSETPAQIEALLSA